MPFVTEEACSPSHRRVFAPIFIVGCERSGTTLLAALLDRHSSIAVTPETHFWQAKAWAPPRSHEEAVDLALRFERVGDLGLDRDDVLAHLSAHPPDMAHAFQAILDAYAKKRGKAICAEKTPAHLYHGSRLLRMYPSSRLIWLVRDGRDVVLSLMKAPWTDANPRRHAVAWRDAAALGLSLERQFPGRVARVRFEDLLEHPREELARVMAFLGLEFEAGQLDVEVPTEVVPAWEAAWKHKATGPLDASRVGAWKREAEASILEALRPIIERALRRLEYSATPIAGFSPCSRVKNRLLAAWSCMVYARSLNPVLARLHAIVRPRRTNTPR